MIPATSVAAGESTADEELPVGADAAVKAATAVRTDTAGRTDTAVRSRTRKAILEAAIAVLATSPNASLAEIASAAAVGRTTLHRYFPERTDLLSAIVELSVEQLNLATERAHLDQGTGISALHRLCHEYFALGHLLSVVFSEPQLNAESNWQEPAGRACGIADTVRRGHDDGTIDAEMAPEWVEGVLWALLYNGWGQQVRVGTPKLTVLRMILRTLDGAVGPKGALPGDSGMEGNGRSILNS